MKWYLMVIGALLITFVVLRIITTPDINEGIAFAVTDGTTTVFGSNEDRQDGEPVVFVRRPTSGTYGSLLLGYQLGGEQYYESGVNDAGLAWALVPMPGTAVTPYPARTLVFANDDIMLKITQEAATVEEAFNIIERTDFGLYIEVQILLADATGAAAIVSPDDTGEMVYTELEAEYLIATNVNPAFEQADGHWRYDQTAAQLAEDPTGDLVEHGFHVLEDISLDDDLRFTIYTYSVDLTDLTLRIAYKRQYDDSLTITLDELFTEYNQQFLLRDLYDEDVVSAGTAEFEAFDSANVTTQVWAIVVGMALNASVIALLIHWMRKMKPQETIDL